YRRRLCVVHNGIEWPRELPARDIARKALSLPPDKIVFLAVGRMKTQKNYRFMLERVSETPDIILLIAGDGELRQGLEQAASEFGVEDRVRFLGNVSRSGVWELLAAADVFIQTSSFEGQSDAVLEAMHAGLAILVSDIPMQRETLCDDADQAVGLLVPLEQPAAWREAMLRLRDDPALRATMGRAAKMLVERRFALARMIDGFEQVFREAAETR